MISRNYRRKSIDDAISRVLKISREEALKKVEKKENKRPVFVISYNPALPSVSHILQKHWRVMVTDPYLKKVFPKPPMVAFRRAQNLKQKLVRAKVPPPPPKRGKRNVVGMKKCNEARCEACPYIKVGTEIKSTLNSTTVKINAALNCTSTNVVYGLFCNKENCRQLYIGQTQRPLKNRLSEHKTSVRTKANNVIGNHFSNPGHSLANLEVTAVEKVFKKGQGFIQKRESMWINKFEAEHQGLNGRK